MSPPIIPTGVLLLGSVPLESTKKVFNKLCTSLPGHLRSLPDGETGDRYNYIGWQRCCFPPETIKLHLGGVDVKGPHPAFTIDSVKPTGYDAAAVASYGEFCQLRGQGIIPSSLRFQVCLPTPLNAVQGHTRPKFHEQLEPLYEQRIQEALARIVAEIPSQDLAIQWDLCFDIMALEYEQGRIEGTQFKAWFSPVKKGIMERISRLCAVIPPAAHLGFHLCYGDLRHKHFIEPGDTRLLVDLANDILDTVVESAIHSVQWIHIPVPKNRIDPEYFEPLKDLQLKGTYLYLGLIHANDEEASMKRIQKAQSFLKEAFGVATECGLGRTPIANLESILIISKRVSRPWS